MGSRWVTVQFFQLEGPMESQGKPCVLVIKLVTPLGRLLLILEEFIFGISISKNSWQTYAKMIISMARQWI